MPAAEDRSRPYLRFALAIAATIASCLLRQFLVQRFGLADLPAFALYYPVIMVVALLGGVWSGLLATALSATLADYFIFAPIHSFRIDKPTQIIALAIFCLMGIFVSVVAERFRRGQQRLRVEDVQHRQAEMLRLSSDAIIVSRLWGGIESWNQGAEQLYGYSEEEALDKDIHELLKTTPAMPWPEIYTRLREQGNFECELQQTTRDGREVTVSARYQRIVGADGIERVLKINRDVTERNLATELQRGQAETIALYLRAMNSAANSIVLTDSDGTIQWVNAAFTRLTGYSAEEAVGHNPRMLKSGKHDDEFYRQLNQTIHSGAVWHGQILNRRKDGRLYDEEMTITPVLTDGVVSHFVAVKEDISERKRAEQQLRESEQQFRTLADSIPQLAWMANADGFIFWYNQRWYEYTGTTAEQMEGWGWQQVHDPEMLPGALEGIHCIGHAVLHGLSSAPR
jgi:PAS domain S-box-containing protein